MSEFGPRIEHDGSGCPCVGMYAKVWLMDAVRGEYFKGVVRVTGGKSWFYGDKNNRDTWTDSANGKKYRPVTAYAIRKPRGLTLLESLLEDLPMEREEA